VYKSYNGKFPWFFLFLPARILLGELYNRSKVSDYTCTVFLYTQSLLQHSSIKLLHTIISLDLHVSA
jgi:hypothetical protein